MTGVAEEFITYLFQKKEQITPSVLKKARQCLVDYCGAAVGGAYFARDKLQAVKAHLPNGVVPIIGTGKKTDGKTAALLNGFQSHMLELDDGQRFAMIHLGGPIISALYSAFNEYSVSLNCLLTGIIMGYEAACRIAIAMQPSHKKMGFHTAGTCGTIGAAIGTAFALQYTKRQMGTVLASAVTSASGLLEIQEQASELKPYNIGNAAMNGLAAALWGVSGLEPPQDILNGERGFFRIFTNSFSNEQLCQATDYFEIERIYVKVHSSCRHCHAPVDAALNLRRSNSFAVQDISKIIVYTYQLAVKGHDHTTIYNASSAKLSIPFCIATALLHGKNDISMFTDAVLTDPDVLALTAKTEVLEDEMYTQDRSKRAARVEIHLKDGSVLTEQIDYAKGEPENPLSEEELCAKVENLMQYSHMGAAASSVEAMLRDEDHAEYLKQL